MNATEHADEIRYATGDHAALLPGAGAISFPLLIQRTGHYIKRVIRGCSTPPLPARVRQQEVLR
jgi:hypothetical protein